MFFSASFDLIAEKTTNSIKMNNPNPCMTCGACCAFFRVSFTGQKLTMLAERFRSVSLSKYPPFIAVCAAPVRKIPDVSLWRELRVKTHIALFTKTVRPHAGNLQCPEKMASRMKHATAPGQNTDFRKYEKSSISTGCTKMRVPSLPELTFPWHYLPGIVNTFTIMT